MSLDSSPGKIPAPPLAMKLPPLIFFGLAFAAVLGVGNVLLNFGLAGALLFLPVFLLGAALPAGGVVAWTARRLGWPISWPHAALSLLGGASLSVGVAIALEAFLPYLTFLLVAPLGFLAQEFDGVFLSGGGDVLERLFASPLIIFFLISTALAAPIPEEFAKALALPLFGRSRLLNERQVFLIGMTSGAGFAILENMLYEGVYAQFSGWTWGGVTLLRGIGSVLHPLCTGLVALGWFRMRQHGAGALLKAYAAAVGLHTLWNGGFDLFVYFTGLGYYGGTAGPEVQLYGTAVEVALIVYLVALAAWLWWLLRRIAVGMAQEVQPTVGLEALSARALAAWALACALVIVPIGAALVRLMQAA